MLHILKTDPIPFQAVWNDEKHFEWRKNDRNYKVGDQLRLQEFNCETLIWSGREILATISYVLQDCYNIPSEYCILSLTNISKKE